MPDVGRPRAPRLATTRCRTAWPARCPGAWKPDQYHNPDNPLAQYETTGPEIWEQTAGRITHFVCGVGTGGTITGIGRYLKERNPAIRTIGADPEGSVYSGGTGRPYLVEGIGEDFWPTTYDPSVVDEVIPISDAESFATARRVTREEGLLIGGSGGTAVAAALQVAAGLPPDAVVVVHIPDSGPRLPVEALRRRVDGRPRLPARRPGPPVGDLLRGRDPSLPVARAHPPRRDGAHGHRDPARVRGEPDAGREARAAGRAGRGVGAVVRARAAPGRRSPTRPPSTARSAT